MAMPGLMYGARARNRHYRIAHDVAASKETLIRV